MKRSPRTPKKPRPTPQVELGRLANATGFLLRRANVVFANHWLHHFANDRLGLTPVQGGMMILIDENPGISQIELARLMKVEGPTAWQLVSRLDRLGYVRRNRSSADRRAHALYLSKKGTLVLDHVERGMAAHLLELLAVLSPRERHRLREMLLRLIAHGDRLNAGRGRDAFPTNAKGLAVAG